MNYSLLRSVVLTFILFCFSPTRYNDSLYMFGGVVNGTKIVNEIWQWHFTHNLWLLRNYAKEGRECKLGCPPIPGANWFAHFFSFDFPGLLSQSIMHCADTSGHDYLDAARGNCLMNTHWNTVWSNRNHRALSLFFLYSVPVGVH